MPWFKVDDGLHSHPKILAAGNAAVGLWTRFGSYCSSYSTDGFVPNSVAKTYGKRAEIARLLDTGMLRETDGGYVMHDFLEYNPSAEKVQQDRADAAERQREHRAKKGGASRRDRPVTNGVSHTTPSRPDPSRPEVLLTSSSVSTVEGPPETDDDDMGQVIDLYVEAKLDAQRNVRSPQGFRRTVGKNARAEHGDRIRERLARGDQPIAIAAELLDSQLDAKRAARKLGLADPNIDPAVDPTTGTRMSDDYWNERGYVDPEVIQPTPGQRAWYEAVSE